MNISLIAVDGINDLVTVASHNVGSGKEDEYRATFKVVFDGENMLVNLNGPVYHLGIKISREELPIVIVTEMIRFIRRFFKKPATGQIPPRQLPFREGDF